MLFEHYKFLHINDDMTQIHTFKNAPVVFSNGVYLQNVDVIQDNKIKLIITGELMSTTKFDKMPLDIFKEVYNEFIITDKDIYEEEVPRSFLQKFLNEPIKKQKFIKSGNYLKSLNTRVTISFNTIPIEIHIEL